MDKIIAQVFQRPLVAVAIAVALPLVGFGIQVEAPFDRYRSNGAGVHFSPPTPLELAGRQVYVAEGCQYCHTQSMRPLPSEVLRYAGSEYGYMPKLEMAEFDYDSPAMHGSNRIGPDLARLAGRLSASDAKRLLQGKHGAEYARGYHNVGYIFGERYDAADGLTLSWRMRAMMQAGVPLSDPMQFASFTAIKGQTRGDALTAYLLSLGRRHKEFAGTYFTK